VIPPGINLSPFLGSKKPNNYWAPSPCSTNTRHYPGMNDMIWALSRNLWNAGSECRLSEQNTPPRVNGRATSVKRSHEERGVT
jgi:hypothetical protein